MRELNISELHKWGPDDSAIGTAHAEAGAQVDRVSQLGAGDVVPEDCVQGGRIVHARIRCQPMEHVRRRSSYVRRAGS